MWQELRTELHPQGLEVVTVALDVDPERARPYIEAAAPDHPSLIDTSHVVDELFGVVNVPNGVWIDEDGMIVRPAEPANVQPSFSERLESGQIQASNYTPEWLDVLTRFNFERETYLGALRDWVANGAASRWAKSPEEVIERSRPRSADHALAAAHFELGEELHRRDATEAAQRQWREAHRLDIENWTYKRQAWALVEPERLSDVYESNWLADVEKLGPEAYYPQLQQ